MEVWVLASLKIGTIGWRNGFVLLYIGRFYKESSGFVAYMELKILVGLQNQNGLAKDVWFENIAFSSRFPSIFRLAL